MSNPLHFMQSGRGCMFNKCSCVCDIKRTLSHQIKISYGMKLITKDTKADAQKTQQGIQIHCYHMTKHIHLVSSVSIVAGLLIFNSGEVMCVW